MKIIVVAVLVPSAVSIRASKCNIGLHNIFLQVYRHMNIGSAKVDADTCSRVPHHLLDVASVRDIFSVGDYYKQADAAMKVSNTNSTHYVTLIFLLLGVKVH